MACSNHRSFYCTMIHCSHHPSIALSVAPWYTARNIHRLHHSSLFLLSADPPLLLLFPDPLLAQSIAPSIVRWSIACSTHRSFYCYLIHCSHHPSLLLLLSDPSVKLSIAPWKIACIIRRSFYHSLIHSLYHPSLLLFLPYIPLAKSVTTSIAASIAPSISPWSTARTIHRSSYCSLIHRLQPLSMIYCRYYIQAG
jgi:hypothetical protein